MSDWIVVDLGFGDAGKGATVDFLVRDKQADLVVRFNGGAQAGHNVVTPDGRHHTFSQFCSGTFVPGVHGLLGPDFLLHPLGMAVEAEHLEHVGVRDAFARTHVSARARVISPYQQAANRVRESLRRGHAHGSCGLGIGECVGDSIAHPDETIRADMLGSPATLRNRLEHHRERKRVELRDAGADHTDLEIFDDTGLVDRVIDVWSEVCSQLRLVDDDAMHRWIAGSRTIIYEGAQGVLLDEDVGFHPHTTWSHCTAQGAIELAGDRPWTRLGVVRTYSTRHGAGPFPTEEPDFGVLEPHNGNDVFAGQFRQGPLDLMLVRYALRAAPMDALAVTCLDRLERPRMCVGYRGVDELPLPQSLDDASKLTALLGTVDPVIEVVSDPVEMIEAQTSVPVWLVANGPSARDRRWQACAPAQHPR